MQDNNRWSSANLVLLHCFVKSVRWRFEAVLTDKLVPQSSFGLVQPGAHCIERRWQRLVQVEVPVQELQEKIRGLNLPLLPQFLV